MAVSLAKQTTNNVSGTFTPNALLYGYFDLNITGNVTINAPTMATDGQIIAIRTTMADGSQPAISWASAFKQSADTLWSGTGPQDASYNHIFFCDGGEFFLLQSAQLA